MNLIKRWARDVTINFSALLIASAVTWFYVMLSGLLGLEPVPDISFQLTSSQELPTIQPGSYLIYWETSAHEIESSSIGGDTCRDAISDLILRVDGNQIVTKEPTLNWRYKTRDRVGHSVLSFEVLTACAPLVISEDSKDTGGSCRVAIGRLSSAVISLSIGLTVFLGTLVVGMVLIRRRLSWIKSLWGKMHFTGHW